MFFHRKRKKNQPATFALICAERSVKYTKASRLYIRQREPLSHYFVYNCAAARSRFEPESLILIIIIIIIGSALYVIFLYTFFNLISKYNQPVQMHSIHFSHIYSQLIFHNGPHDERGPTPEKRALLAMPYVTIMWSHRSHIAACICASIFFFLIHTYMVCSYRRERKLCTIRPIYCWRFNESLFDIDLWNNVQRLIFLLCIMI